MRSRVPVLLACLLAAAPGCYSYRVTQLDAVPTGAPMRLRISPDEAERLMDLRLTEDRLVYGTLVSSAGTELMLDTQVGVNDATRGTRAFMQRITIPVAEVREVEERRFDGLKTGALVGGVAVGVGIIAAAAIGGGDGNDSPGGPGTEEFRRLPFGLRLRLPIGF